MHAKYAQEHDSTVYFWSLIAFNGLILRSVLHMHGTVIALVHKRLAAVPDTSRALHAHSSSEVVTFVERLKLSQYIAVV